MYFDDKNSEVFWYRTVDEESCVECGRCLKTCPVENEAMHRNTHRQFGHGGIRMILILCVLHPVVLRTVMQMGDVVYGASYDKQLVVSHIEIENDADREKIQSSKYVQSDPKDSYSKVKRKLAEGKTVLYTGMPCQIAGMYAFFGAISRIYIQLI